MLHSGSHGHECLGYVLVLLLAAGLVAFGLVVAEGEHALDCTVETVVKLVEDLQLPVTEKNPNTLT